MSQNVFYSDFAPNFPNKTCSYSMNGSLLHEWFHERLSQPKIYSLSFRDILSVLLLLLFLPLIFVVSLLFFLELTRKSGTL